MGFDAAYICRSCGNSNDMGSSLNFLTGSDDAGVLEDEEDVDAEAACCLMLFTSILVMGYASGRGKSL